MTEPKTPRSKTKAQPKPETTAPQLEPELVAERKLIEVEPKQKSETEYYQALICVEGALITLPTEDERGTFLIEGKLIPVIGIRNKPAKQVKKLGLPTQAVWLAWPNLIDDQQIGLMLSGINKETPLQSGQGIISGDVTEIGQDYFIVKIGRNNRRKGISHVRIEGKTDAPIGSFIRIECQFKDGKIIFQPVKGKAKKSSGAGKRSGRLSKTAPS